MGPAGPCGPGGPGIGTPQPNIDLKPGSALIVALKIGSLSVTEMVFGGALMR
jgi:hypothetical protein